MEITYNGEKMPQQILIVPLPIILLLAVIISLFIVVSLWRKGKTVEAMLVINALLQIVIIVILLFE